jgi:hypothetical protein
MQLAAATDDLGKYRDREVVLIIASVGKALRTFPKAFRAFGTRFVKSRDGQQAGGNDGCRLT